MANKNYEARGERKRTEAVFVRQRSESNYLYAISAHRSSDLKGNELSSTKIRPCKTVHILPTQYESNCIL